jgi:hypothetical protein
MISSVTWPDSIDEILGGDQAVTLGSVTPASGVVLTPLTNFALRDRRAGTVASVNSSVGVWRKLERIRRNPRVALAYHTRQHGFSDRPEYVLVQGRASLASPHPRYLDSIRENAERFAGDELGGGRLWRRWLRVWHLRVEIEIAVERLIVWPDLACREEPQVHGAALPADPPAPQRPPARGTGPRIDHGRAAARAQRLPHVLLGWVGADRLPIVMPAEVAGTDERGILLEVPEGVVPAGGRRAGLTAHWFARHTVGQEQRVHTGWLEAEPGDRRVLYAPHTETGYRLPRSSLLFRLAAGFVTRRGLRGARRAGLVAG